LMPRIQAMTSADTVNLSFMVMLLSILNHTQALVFATD